MQNDSSFNLKASATERVLAAAGLAVGAAGTFAVAWFNPVTAGFFPQCPLYQMTGLACPGCGLTRGFHALFHGDVLTALGYNAMLPFYVLIFAYIAISMVLVVVRGRGFAFKLFPPKFLYGFMVLSLVFAVARNLPFYPFTLLFP